MSENIFDLGAAASEFGVNLSPHQLMQFDQYKHLLIEWNQKINLTAVVESAEIEIRHFLDAISCATVTGNLNHNSLIDIGTGAGFPGLPLKILYPDLHLTLVESVKKKSLFLERVVRLLHMTNVHISTERAELLGQTPEHREQYDWAMARGVAELRILAEYLLPFCYVGGSMLAQKGESAKQEIELAQEAIAKLGGRFREAKSIRLPMHTNLHYLVVIQKEKSTPSNYPRRPGVPAKRPL